MTFVKVLHTLGSPMVEQYQVVRDSLILSSKVYRLLLQPKTWRWNEISKGIITMGVASLPPICISTTFAGLVITHEIAYHMDKALHSVSMIPGFTGQFILRELGIAIPALLLVSKVGASTTAEIGSMKITEQVDALRLLGIDPVGYLVLPRFIACVISSACLTLIASAITLLGAVCVAVAQYNFSFTEYINALHHFLGVKDILCTLVKGVIYGSVIPIVSCTYGFRCRGGAEGVGTATTQSVVTSSVLIILYDFVLTYLFTLMI